MNDVSTEQNKMLTRQGFDLVSQKKYADIEKLLSPDFVGHFPSQPEVRGPAGFSQLVHMYQSAFPDFMFKIEDLIAEGDKVVARWSWHGTNQGSFMGMPATGKPVTITGCSTFRIADGKVTEQWNSQDDLGMLQQMGVIPMPNQQPH